LELGEAAADFEVPGVAGGERGKDRFRTPQGVNSTGVVTNV